MLKWAIDTRGRWRSLSRGAFDGLEEFREPIQRGPAEKFIPAAGTGHPSGPDQVYGGARALKRIVLQAGMMSPWSMRLPAG